MPDEQDSLSWAEFADGRMEWTREFWVSGPPPGWEPPIPGACAWQALVDSWFANKIEDEVFFSTLKKYKGRSKGSINGQ